MTSFRFIVISKNWNLANFQFYAPPAPILRGTYDSFSPLYPTCSYMAGRIWQFLSPVPRSRPYYRFYMAIFCHHMQKSSLNSYLYFNSFFKKELYTISSIEFQGIPCNWKKSQLQIHPDSASVQDQHDRY